MAEHAFTLVIRSVKCCFFGFFVAGETKLFRRRGEVYESGIFLDFHLMAGGAPHGNGAVYMRSLALFFMALQAFGRVYIFLEWYRVFARVEPHGKGEHQNKKEQLEVALHLRRPPSCLHPE